MLGPLVSLSSEIFNKSDNIIFTEFEDGIKAIDISSSEKDLVIEINGMASKIFLSCDGKTTLSKIISNLNISYKENEDDISNLISFLKNHSLIN